MGSSVAICGFNEKISPLSSNSSSGLSTLSRGYHIRDKPIKDNRVDHENIHHGRYYDDDDVLDNEIVACGAVKQFICPLPNRQPSGRLEVTFEGSGHVQRTYNIEPEDYKFKSQMSNNWVAEPARTVSSAISSSVNGHPSSSAVPWSSNYDPSLETARVVIKNRFIGSKDS